MSLRGRLSKLERAQAAGPKYPGGTLVAEQWTGDDAGPRGMFRCTALDNPPGDFSGWGVPENYHYTEQQLAEIAREQRKMLIVVLYAAQEIAP
jgi:hypothetical protein